MKIYDKLTGIGVFNEIDRICKSNETSYTLQSKSARLNDALDRYLSLAFSADGRWNFDDINETSPPIDYQSIVSGTNRYKFSAFTEEILSLIRLEVLDSAGKGISLIPEVWNSALNAVVPGNESGRTNASGTSTFQELYVNATSGTPAYYIKYGDFIYLRPKPNYAYTNGLLAYFNRPVAHHNCVTFTVTIASPGVFTSTAHGLAAGDGIMLYTDGALPTGLATGTVYYVKSTGLAADTFQVSTTYGTDGTAVNTSGSQSGNHSYLKVNQAPGIPTIHHNYLARYASYPYLIENAKFNEADRLAVEIAKDENEILKYFSRRDKDIPNRLIPFVEDDR